MTMRQGKPTIVRGYISIECEVKENGIPALKISLNGFCIAAQLSDLFSGKHYVFNCNDNFHRWQNDTQVNSIRFAAHFNGTADGFG